MINPMGAAQPAPPQMRDAMIEEMWGNLVFLYSQVDKAGLAIQHLGQEEIDGKAVEALLITPPGITPFRFYLDGETLFPVKKAGQTVTQQGPTEIETTLSDYRDVGGVKLPFKQTIVQNGQPAGESVTQAIEINPEIPEDAFAAPEE